MSVLALELKSRGENHPFRCAILQNWLCNPTGKNDGWCGWDWLQELNKLYTKVSIY